MTITEIYLGVPCTYKAQQRALDQGYSLQPFTGPFRSRYVMAVRPGRYIGQISKCVDTAATIFSVTRDEMLGDVRRHYHIRWAAMWAARQLGYSSVKIGYVLDRDHTTVLYGERRCGDLQSTDDEYREACETLLRMVREAA